MATVAETPRGFKPQSVGLFLSHYIAAKPARDALRSMRQDRGHMGMVHGVIKSMENRVASQWAGASTGGAGITASAGTPGAPLRPRPSLTFGSTVIVDADDQPPAGALPAILRPPSRIILRQPKVAAASSGQCYSRASTAQPGARGAGGSAVRARLAPRPRTSSPASMSPPAAPAYSHAHAARGQLSSTFPPAAAKRNASPPASGDDAMNTTSASLPLPGAGGDGLRATTAGSVDGRRNNFDVFLCDDNSGWPMLGRVRSPLRNLPPPQRSVDIILGSGNAVATNMNTQLEAFEKQHEKLLYRPVAEQGVVKAVTSLKQNRVRQLMGLKKSPLPMLFTPLEPERVQRLYVEHCGSITSTMTLENFSAMVNSLVAPEPPLPEPSMRWIFKTVDQDDSGKVDFVEFISTIYSVVTPQMVKDSISKLFSALSHKGYVPVTHLKAVYVVEAVKGVIATTAAVAARKPQQPLTPLSSPAGIPVPAGPKGSEKVLARRTLNMWRVTAAMIETVSSDMDETRAMAPEEFQTLLYLNKAIMDQIASAPL